MLYEIGLIILFWFSKTERDLVHHNPDKALFPHLNWYIENRWRTHSFWLKNVFTMFLDGWHFWEFINTASASLLFGVAIDNLWYSLIVYFVGGVIMSIRNGSLFRYKRIF